MNNRFYAFFLFFLLINCAFETTSSKILPGARFQNSIFHFYSTDKVLVGIICKLIEIESGKCISDSELEYYENPSEVKHIYIETQIRKSSSDYFLNSGKSILSLTFGIFLTNSAEVDFIFFIKDQKETALENTSLSSFAKVGYWGILPIYMGFIATNLGTLLNSYRRPDHLQKYCLYENPGKLRQIFEVKKEEYCKDYEVFLQDSFYKIEKDFFLILQETVAEK